MPFVATRASAWGTANKSTTVFLPELTLITLRNLTLVHHVEVEMLFDIDHSPLHDRVGLGAHSGSIQAAIGLGPCGTEHNTRASNVVYAIARIPAGASDNIRRSYAFAQQAVRRLCR